MGNKTNISDEMIASYLDGNATAGETMQILQALKTNPALRETLDIALRIDENDMLDLPIMQMAADSGENMCDIMCETYILRRRGIAHDENHLVAIARENKWLQDKGTPLHSIGQLLAHEGLMVTRVFDAKIDNLANALVADNDVIVALDRDKLYPELPDEEDAVNHAVVVTSVDIDKGIISLFDPPHRYIQEFSIKTFENAWKESQHYMVRITAN